MLEQFLHPEFLWLLLLLPFVAAWMWFKRHKKKAELHFPGNTLLPKTKTSHWSYMHYIPDVLRLSALAFIIIAIARPQSAEENSQTRSSEGIDIVMALDISSSMLSKDLKPNRLEATKNVAAEFVSDRPNDRIGLVVYSGESYTQVPLTTDHKIVLNALKELKYGIVEGGTAIGMGLATAVNRLKESDSKGKVIILLTDGENNTGQIDPLTAAQLAIEYNIRVYTIGVGTKGMAMSPVAYNYDGSFIYRSIPVSIDEDLLRSIAEATNGNYFRATDNEKLEAIYQEINKLEKSKVEELKYYSYEEHFRSWALLAFTFFSLELLLRFTLLKSIL